MNVITQEKIARSNPSSLLFNPAYFQNKSAYVIIGMIALGVISFAWSAIQFFPYDFDESDNGNNFKLINFSLYALIFIMASIGLIKIIYTSLKIEVEQAIATVIGSKAETKNRQLGNNTIRIEELKVLTELSRNTNLLSSMERLFSLIVSEARDKKFVSTTILMEPYRDESNNDVFNVGIYQRIVLQLGVLGTFIGLINAFKGLNLTNLDDSLIQISGSLQYAFSTSIAGLVASIVLAMIFIMLRKKQEEYFKSMEKATVELTSLGRKSISEGAVINSLNQATEALKQNKTQLRAVSDRVNSQTDIIENGISKLKVTEEHFFKSLDSLTQKEDAFVEKMTNIYETLSPDKMSVAFKDKLEETTLAYFSNTKENYDKLNVLIEGTVLNMGTLQENLQKQTDYLSKLNTNQEGFLATLSDTHITKQITKAMENSSDVISQKLVDKTELFSDKIGGFTQQLNRFNNSTNTYLNNRHKMEQLVIWISIGLLTTLVIYSLIN